MASPGKTRRINNLNSIQTLHALTIVAMLPQGDLCGLLNTVS